MKKILIVEDEPFILMMIKDCLDDRFNLIIADDGKMATELYKEHKPDLTLMDINMPGMKGDEAITKIFKYDPDAKIIAITACNYTSEELGVPVLRKVFDDNELLDIVGKRVGMLR